MDPDNFLYVLLDSDNWGSKGNYSFYKNDEVDKLLAGARVETDWDKRIELYQHAEKLIVEDAPWVFLFFYSTSLLPQEWVKGIYLPAMGDYATRLETVWISK
jgi:peptide/nickel transport system substrate-binding protein/oligopeptide transport system substrate-binding protein